MQRSTLKQSSPFELLPMLVMAAIAIGTGWIFVSNALGGTGDVTPRTTVGAATMAPLLKVTLDGRWVSGDGYRPVRVRVETVRGVPLPRDRQLTIRLRPNKFRSNMPERTIRTTLEIPAGSSTYSTIVYIPEDPQTDSYIARMWIGDDTRRYKDVSLGTHGSSNAGAGTPRVIVLDRDAPSFEQLGSRNAGSYRGEKENITFPIGLIQSMPMMLGNNSSAPSWNEDKTWRDVVDDVPVCTIIPPKDIPPRWIGLTSVDIVCISLDDLQEFRKLPSLNAQWQSLMHWTRSGGNLWITGCGEEFQRLPDAANLLGMPTPAEDELPADVGWRSANTKKYGELVEGEEEVRTPLARNTVSSSQTEKNVEKPTKPAPPNPIHFREYQLGTVVLFKAEEALENEDRWYWHWIYNSLGCERWRWVERNGLSGQFDNPGFWEFMVPGVGLAPVRTFVVLLTLFVIGIGPLSFALLRRWQRPGWLMFTVPIAAALVTLALVSYALLTDGLSVQGRSRTITHIDQRNKCEATWSRQAYYAGLPPSSGLKFPADVAVYPVDFVPLSTHVGDRVLDWTPEQHLRRGYLGARETSQFLVQSCGATKKRLVFSNLDKLTPSATPTVVNHLGAKITDLYVRDKAGQIFHAANIGKGNQATLKPSNGSDASTTALRWSGTQCILPPDGVDPSAIDVNRGIFGINYRWNNYDGENEPENCAAEKIISQFMSMPAGRYLAILKKPVDIQTGFPRVRWEKTVHLIVGEW